MTTDANTWLSADARRSVIDDLLVRIRENYVFPDAADRMASDVSQRLQNGLYDDVRDGAQLAARLTADLQEVSRDLHLRVRFSDDRLPPVETSDPYDDPVFYAGYQREAALLRNNGFERVERLAGNVGYICLTEFDDARVMGETACAAMTLVADTAALIVDVRDNGGGDPFAVALVTTYLFGPEPVHLNSLYNRPKDRTDQFWTLPYVPGRRFGPDKPVYVLTTNRSFSAAEEFAYNLQQLGRATLVGERTRGGAHPRDVFRLNDHMEVNIPTGRAINPVSETNWEGTGVAPDIEVPADEALPVARRHALERIKTTIPIDRGDAERQLSVEIERTLATIAGDDTSRG